jgi:DnaJ-class molecular chaperone
MTVVSRAFQVLSDPDKRAAFDRHGDDPDSRTAGMGGASPFGNGFPGMRTTYRGAGGMYGEEMSPDELFNMFFGGGFSGGGFNGTPQNPLQCTDEKVVSDQAYGFIHLVVPAINDDNNNTPTPNPKETPQSSTNSSQS